MEIRIEMKDEIAADWLTVLVAMQLVFVVPVHQELPSLPSYSGAEPTQK